MNQSYLYPAFIFVVLFSSILSIINSRILFYIILFLSFFLDNLLYIAGIPSTYLLVIDLLIIEYFIYSMFADGEDIRVKYTIGYAIKKYLIIFLTIVFLIEIINFILKPSPLILALRSSLNFFRYVLLFFALVKMENDSKFYNRIFKLIIIIGLIQIPYSILQYIFYKGTSFDFKGGSISIGGYSTHGGGVFASVLFVYYFIKYRFENAKKYFFIAFLFIIPIILSSTKAALVFIVVNILFYYLILQKGGISKYIKSLLWGGFLLLIGYYFLAYILPLLDPRNFGAIDLFTQADKFQLYTENTTDLGRVNRIQFFYVWGEMFNNNIWEVLFGGGLGSYTLGETLGMEGAGIKSFGLFLTGLHSFAYFVLELGLINLLVYFFFIVKIISNIKISFRSQELNLENKYILGFTAVFLFSMIYSSVYGKLWAIQGIAFTQWFLLAALTKLDIAVKT